MDLAEVGGRSELPLLLCQLKGYIVLGKVDGLERGVLLATYGTAVGLPGLQVCEALLAKRVATLQIPRDSLAVVEILVARWTLHAYFYSVQTKN